MRERSSTSCVRRWPDREAVVKALLEWVSAEASRHPELLRLGYFGSYARGDWGVGSDLDLVAVVATSSEAFLRRGIDWSTEELPVPTDLLVYTEQEWAALVRAGGRFSKTLERELVWCWPT